MTHYVGDTYRDLAMGLHTRALEEATAALRGPVTEVQQRVKLVQALVLVAAEAGRLAALLGCGSPGPPPVEQLARTLEVFKNAMNSKLNMVMEEMRLAASSVDDSAGRQEN